MTKKFRELLEKMPKERQQRIEQHSQQLMETMPLQELCKALQLTQQQVATTLSMNQAAVSKIENQTDMYVNTLRCFIEAMGGNLQIVAHFPHGEIEINSFAQTDYRFPQPVNH